MLGPHGGQLLNGAGEVGGGDSLSASNIGNPICDNNSTNNSSNHANNRPPAGQNTPDGK